MGRRGLLGLLGAATAIALHAGPAEAAPPSTGVVLQHVPTSAELAQLDRTGADTVRFLIRWRGVEPTEGAYDWSSVDAVAEAARGHDLELLPFVYGSPEWIAAEESHPPLDGASARAAWRRFLTALVARYGRGGAFWSGNGANPITRWQIWNEPNFDIYWDRDPDPAEYARLLSISANAIGRADRRADVIAAGLAPVVGIGTPWWSYLRRLYRAPDFAAAADGFALHPYAVTIEDLTKQLELARKIMAANGDRKAPLAVTEIGWSSGRGQAPLLVGPKRQASLLGRAFDALSQPKWRVSEIEWYALRDTPLVEAFCDFCAKSGLFNLAGKAKPAWAAFKRAVR